MQDDPSLIQTIKKEEMSALVTILMLINNECPGDKFDYGETECAGDEFDLDIDRG